MGEGLHRVLRALSLRSTTVNVLGPKKGKAYDLAFASIFAERLVAELMSQREELLGRLLVRGGL